jgi:IS30 family transposase
LQFLNVPFSGDGQKTPMLKEIQNKLNNRPRKVLGFLTPIEYTKKYYNEMKN